MDIDEQMLAEIDNNYSRTMKPEEQQPCRICLSEEIPHVVADENPDPLIAVCKCNGSMKYIHYQCLKNWLETKQETKTTDFAYSYYWKALCCELCKMQFPDAVTLKDKEFKILDYNVPSEGDYLIFETYSKLQSKSRIMHVVNFSKSNEIKLGRGHESNIRITDISVSRVHSIVTCVDGKFYLRDENSKFGTLISLDTPKKLTQHHSVQIRNTVVEMEIPEIEKILCFSKNKNKINYDP